LFFVLWVDMDGTSLVHLCLHLYKNKYIILYIMISGDVKVD